MPKQKMNLVIRLIPALVVFGIIVTCAFLWSDPGNRGGSFYYFLILMLYAAVMLFFSDVIFLQSKKPLHIRIPFAAVAAIHIGYVVLIIILRLIFLFASDVYFILLTLLATSIQIALSLWLFQGVLKIAGSQEQADQKRNVKLHREILLMELSDTSKATPALAQNYEMMRRLEVFTNTWQNSPEQDTVHTVQTTDEINAATQALIGMIKAGETGTEVVSGQIANITSLIERRKKLLQLK